MRFFHAHSLMIGTAMLLTLGVAGIPAASNAAVRKTAPDVIRHASIGKPEETMTLSVGSGQMVRLPMPMTDLFVADDKIADVQVRSAQQLYIFG
jgi:pilus assembly protein CpaC